MNEKDVKVGMKVRPLKKSYWGELEGSKVWEDAQKVGHDYLYVSGYEYEEQCWVLSDIRFSKALGKPKGDFFLAKDFVPYNKK